MRPTRFASTIEPSLIRSVTMRARPTSLHLGLGQPDLPLAPWALEALRAIEHAPYTDNRGRRDLVAAIEARHPGDGVIVTVGTGEALVLAILGLVERGTDVLVPAPSFPVYPNLVRAAGANPIPYGFGPDFALEPERIAEAWTPNTVAVLLNSPSNPTGAVADPAAIRAVAELCDARGAFWISDEIYEDFVWVGEHASPRRHSTNGVVVTGISKSHAAMGLRIGWLAGPRDVVDGLIPLHQHIVACAPSPSQVAALAMLEHHDEQVRSIRREFEVRRQITIETLDRWGVDHGLMQGAFYSFIDVRPHLRPGETTLELALAMLDQIDVVTIPGSGFGAAGEGYLRLAYTVQPDILTEALDRVGRFLQERSTP